MFNNINIHFVCRAGTDPNIIAEELNLPVSPAVAV